MIKDVFTIADDLEMFCSDVDVLGVKFTADQIMTATFLKSTCCICYERVHWLRGLHRLRLVLGFVPSRFQWLAGLIVMLISAATSLYS